MKKLILPSLLAALCIAASPAPIYRNWSTTNLNPIVTSNQIADKTITGAKIADATITTNLLTASAYEALVGGDSGYGLTNITASNAIVAGTIETNLLSANAYEALVGGSGGIPPTEPSQFATNAGLLSLKAGGTLPPMDGAALTNLPNTLRAYTKLTNALFVGTNTIVDVEAFGASPTADPYVNGAAISNALAFAVTNNSTGILRFGSGRYNVHGHFRIPESGGRPNVYDQPGLLILGAGNTTLRQTDTNAANGPFWRGGANWQDIVIEGPGVQYGCTGLVQSLPGNNVFLRTTWSYWGGYAMLFENCTHVVHLETRLAYNRIGYGAGYKHDGAYFLGRVDNNWTGIEIGAKGSDGSLGPSANGFWRFVGNGNTNAAIVVGGNGTSGQIIEIYVENNTGVSTNGYIHLGHDPAVWDASVVESSGLVSVDIRNTFFQQKVGASYIRPFTVVQKLVLDNVRSESAGPLIDFAHSSANIRNIDARFCNVASGPTLTWYGTESISRPTFHWGIDASTAHFDYTAFRAAYPFSYYGYYAAKRGAFDYAWISGADYEGTATRYASLTLTNWGGSATNYVLDMRDVNIQQNFPMSRWASNYFGNTWFGGSVGMANGYFVKSNALSSWPTAPRTAGEAYIGNSNGVLYALSSGMGSAWGRTNVISQPSTRVQVLDCASADQTYVLTERVPHVLVKSNANYNAYIVANGVTNTVTGALAWIDAQPLGTTNWVIRW